jgi:calcium-dependent protein kinase
LKFSKAFDRISECAKDLISKMITKDPKMRISAREALEHEFFRSQVDTNKVYAHSLEWLKNLKSPKTNIKFYQAVTAYLTHNFGLNDDTIKMSNLFKSLDVNCDGKLSKEELFAGFRNIDSDVTEEEIGNILDDIDDDGNGYIEYEEFMRSLIKKENLFTDKNLKAAFDFFDQNQSGTITFEEMKSVIFAGKDYSDAIFDEFLKQINKNRDEDIDFEEFKNIMINLKTE